MTSDAQENKGWLLPDPIDGYGLVCVEFNIPDAPEYRQAVDGAIRELTKWWNWEKSGNTGDRRATDVATQFRNILFDSLKIGACNVPITAIRLEDCMLQVQIDNDPEWVDVGDMTACGAVGPQGPAGQDGQDGQDGSDGQDGQDGAQGPVGPQGPAGQDGQDGQDGSDAPVGENGGGQPPDTTTPTDDTDRHLCAVAQSVAQWTKDNVESRTLILRSALNAAKDVGDQLTDLLDAVPVVGAAVNNVIDLCAEIAEAGDWDDFLGLINDPAWVANLSCVLYCSLKASAQTSFTLSIVYNSYTDMLAWSGVQLPGGPFLNFYGQIFAVMAATIPDYMVWRTAYVHLDETSDDCEILCVECDDDGGGTVANWHTPSGSVDEEDDFISVYAGPYTGTAAGGGVWISEREGSTDKEIIQLVTDRLAHAALESKRYTFYGAYDHVGFYGSWQGNTFEGRIGCWYMADNGNWYGGVPMTSLIGPQLPIDGSEVELGYFDPPSQFGGPTDPEGDARRYAFTARNYNGWRITRIVESERP